MFYTVQRSHLDVSYIFLEGLSPHKILHLVAVLFPSTSEVHIVVISGIRKYKLSGLRWCHIMLSSVKMYGLLQKLVGLDGHINTVTLSLLVKQGKEAAGTK
jgi:hypothetical protein